MPLSSMSSQGGCIMKLEEFIRSQLYILTAVGIGIAFLQVKRKPPDKNPSSCEHLFWMCNVQHSWSLSLMLRVSQVIKHWHFGGRPDLQPQIISIWWPGIKLSITQVVPLFCPKGKRSVNNVPCVLFLFFQLVGMMFTCCLYRNLEEDPYWLSTYQNHITCCSLVRQLRVLPIHPVMKIQTLQML